MNLVFLAIFCLILGITSGELFDQIKDKGALVKDASNKDLSTRKLLYVVGVYPEWEKQILNFKKKWGEKGEKYLNQSNVYIHGDVQDNTARRIDAGKITEEPTMSNEDLPIIPESRRNYSKLDYNDGLIERAYNNMIKYKNMDPDMIKSELSRIKQINATQFRRNDDIDKKLQKYKNFVEDIMPEKRNFNSKLRELKEDVMLNTYLYPDKMNENMIPINSGNLEKEDITKSKDDLIQRRYKNINKIYRNTWARSNNLDKEDLNSNEDRRKSLNLDKIHNRVLTRNELSNDMNDIENPLGNNDEVHLNYLMNNSEMEDVVDDDDRKYIFEDHETNSEIPTSNFGNRDILKHTQKQYTMNPELELKWFKEVLIPRIINDKINSNLGFDEMKINPNVDDYAEKIRDERNLNPKLLDVREELKRKLTNRKQKMTKKRTIKTLVDNNEDTTNAA